MPCPSLPNQLILTFLSYALSMIKPIRVDSVTLPAYHSSRLMPIPEGLQTHSYELDTGETSASLLEK